MIRTRFAPSPTGYLHVGGLRTALYAYLLAKKEGGKFLLRIEDTDQERLVPGAAAALVRALAWAGIAPDEGVVSAEGEVTGQSGDKGPYIQSERLAIYKKYAEELIAAGHAYYCFCTSERLEKLRENQQARKIPTGYDQYCLKNVPLDEAKKRIEAGESAVVRMIMPNEGESKWNDLVRGEVSFKNELVDDQVLIKSDGFPTYHLAVVVDDHLMEITHVIRGEEWVSSTPKHLQLYKYFGWQAPQFAHLSLILNPDKSKLSKRQGDVAVEDYRAKGYLPEALVNFIAFLGWNPGTEKELYTIEELIKDFSLEKVTKAGAVFNVEKLNWFNKEYLKKLSNAELVDRAKPWLTSVIPSAAEVSLLEKAVSLEKERITTLAELPQAIKFVFELPEYTKETLVWRKGTPEEVQKILPEVKTFLESVSEGEWNKTNLEEKLKTWIAEKGYSAGSVLWPLRVSLSGQQNSPGPFEIAEVLGKDESLRRVELALQKL